MLQRFRLGEGQRQVAGALGTLQSRVRKHIAGIRRRSEDVEAVLEKIRQLGAHQAVVAALMVG